VPIDTPPFYGFHPVRPAVNHTLGGLVVDPQTCEVLDAAGKPIDGLYAAGTVVNWAYGKPFDAGGVTSYRGSYHAGASSGAGTALVFGRLAGAQAVRSSQKAAA
jgi:predicted oxidoreductase